MDIFETLRLEHADIKGLLEDLINATMDKNESSIEWAEVLSDLKIALTVHNRAEEAVFYDALESIAHNKELAEIKTEEHQLAESLLNTLGQLDPQDKVWNDQIGLLKNELESHIAEEETLVFSSLMPLVDDDQAMKMARDYERIRSGGEFVKAKMLADHNKTYSRS